MENQKIKVGVIGAGYWGKNLIRNFNSTGRSLVKFVCDLLQDNLQRTKVFYPDTLLTNNYIELLDDEELNLICIATPPETHFKIAKKCIEAGKNVLIEKPMCKTVREAKNLISLANERKVKIFVDHTFVFSAPVQKIKEYIETKKIGNLLYFDSERINLGLLQDNVNVIWDLAPHDFSIFSYLFPGHKLLSVKVLASKHKHPNLEDMAHIMVKCEKDLIMHIHVSWLSPVKIRKLIVGGQKGMIWYDDIHPFEKVKFYDKGVNIDMQKDSSFFPTYREGDITIPKVDNYETLNFETNHIIDCLEGKSKPLVDGEEGLKVVKLLQACDQAISEEKEVFLK